MYERILQVEVGGRGRECKVLVPEGHRTGEALVLVLHGAGGNQRSIEKVTRFSEKAEKEGFIVAYPDGTGKFKGINTWNAGFCCGHAYEEGVDDISFIREVIALLREEHAPERVLVTGVSNGGMMAHLIGATMEVDAIAPVAASAGGVGARGEFNVPSPERPVSVLIIHGTDDLLVPFDGGPPAYSREGGAHSYLSVEDSTMHWVRANGCSPMPRIIEDDVTRRIYDGGKGGSTVEVLAVKGGGHCWPGGTSRICGGDEPSDRISATDAIWEFFMRATGGHSPLD
jgi:polyhydroxybutyrate depolymerase